MSPRESGDARGQTGSRGAPLQSASGEPAADVFRFGRRPVERAVSQRAPGRCRSAQGNEGHCNGAPPGRLSARACDAGTTGPAGEPEEAETALSRRELQVRKRGGRKRALGTRRPMLVPEQPNERWSLDFVSDAFTDGRRFRVLAIVDNFSRECLALVADTSLSGLRVTRELTAVMARGGRPRTIVS